MKSDVDIDVIEVRARFQLGAASFLMDIGIRVLSDHDFNLTEIVVRFLSDADVELMEVGVYFQVDAYVYMRDMGVRFGDVFDGRRRSYGSGTFN